MTTNIHDQRILILDFGSQYTQLIARRVREIGVYCELWAWDVTEEQIREFNPQGIILSGGPMINGYHKGKKVGSGTIVWEARRMHARGEINYSQFIDLVAKGSPSIGHCNTMGTALTMNSVIEALGMSLPGCAAIPAPYVQRKKFSYETGKKIVKIVENNLTPKKILIKNFHLKNKNFHENFSSEKQKFS